MKNLSVVGWDNGYDFEKFTIGQDEKIKFPSVVHRPINNKNILHGEEYNFIQDNMIIEYENTTYFIGDYAVLQDGQGGERNYARNKYKDSTEIAKFLSGISLLTEDKKVNIDLLVLGLSIHTYHDEKENLIDFYKDNTFRYIINNQERKITIGDVICIPQGVGAYYDQILSFNGKIKEHDLLDTRYGLIDIGGNTTDAFVGEGLTPVNESQLGLESGLSDAFKSIAEGVPYNLVQKAFLDGKDYVSYGKKEYNNIQDKCQSAFGRLAKEIYKELEDHWNRQLNRVEVIVLTGGGAKVLNKILKDIFINEKSKKVIVVDDPQFSNVNGYLKLGLYEQRRKEVIA